MKTYTFLTRAIVLAIAVGYASVASAAQFTLSWTDNSTNESGFRIEEATPGNDFVEIATVGANVTSFVRSGLPNSQTFSFRLRAYNAAGNSGYSNVATGTTPPPVDPGPLAPEDFELVKLHRSPKFGGAMVAHRTEAGYQRLVAQRHHKRMQKLTRDKNTFLAQTGQLNVELSTPN